MKNTRKDEKRTLNSQKKVAEARDFARKAIHNHYNFTEIYNPTPQQCLEYLHFPTKNHLTRITLKSRMRNIPEKHREFCEIQLKLEGLWP